MSGWPTKALGDLCEITIGKTPPRNVPRYWGQGHAWLSIADMGQGRVLRRTKESITPAAVQDGVSGRLVPPGTVLLSFKLSIGKLGIAAVPLYTNEAIAALAIRDAGKLSPEYLLHALAAADLQARTDRAVMGMTLNKAKMQRLRVPLPPLPEQRRIAAILDKADAVRRKRQQTLALADQFLRSAFLDMFGDPVTNPKRWPIKKLGDLAETKLGKMLSKASLRGENPVEYLGNSNVRWREFDLSSLATMDFTADELKKLDVQDGDLLVCEGGEVGRCAIWRGERPGISFQKALHRVRCHPGALVPEYLQELLMLMAETGALVGATSTATIAHLTGVRLKQLRIPVPPVALQMEFVGEYRVQRSLRMRLTHTANLVQGLRESLTRRAFQGELAGV